MGPGAPAFSAASPPRVDVGGLAKPPPRRFPRARLAPARGRGHTTIRAPLATAARRGSAAGAASRTRGWAGGARPPFRFAAGPASAPRSAASRASEATEPRRGVAARSSRGRRGAATRASWAPRRRRRPDGASERERDGDVLARVLAGARRGAPEAELRGDDVEGRGRRRAERRLVALAVRVAGDERDRRGRRRGEHLGGTRAIRRRFDAGVPRARVPERASALRARSEGRSLVQNQPKRVDTGRERSP